MGFVKNTLVKIFREKGLIINEIISDYRHSRQGDRGIGCIPGTEGFISDILDDIKNPNVWIKCMHSPIWIRDNIGDADKEPELPFQNVKEFEEWLYSNIGLPSDVDMVVIFGLTLDCCVMSTAQKLSWRGYKVKILYEATDSMNDNGLDKNTLTSNPPILN